MSVRAAVKSGMSLGVSFGVALSAVVMVLCVTTIALIVLFDLCRMLLK